MHKNWNTAIITQIAAAVHVAPGKGRNIHNDRPFHGLVINDGGKISDYCFFDGTVLHTEDLAVHYLPKGSSYRVKNIVPGDCYAINFDLKESLGEKPFTLTFRDSGAVLALFKKAVAAWREHSPNRQITALCCLYGILEKLMEESRRNYLPSARETLLAPAVEQLHRDFTSNELSVAELAGLCQVSKPYFRKLFFDKFGMNPKQYMTKLRMNHAEQLLQSGEFSVAETAALCGYAEPCHFTREFTKWSGLSPARYKRAAQA